MQAAATMQKLPEVAERRGQGQRPARGLGSPSRQSQETPETFCFLSRRSSRSQSGPLLSARGKGEGKEGEQGPGHPQALRREGREMMHTHVPNFQSSVL